MFRLLAVIFSVAVIVVSYFLWERLIGFNQISTKPVQSASYWNKYTSNHSFARYLANFVPVNLPLVIQSDNLHYKSFPALLADDLLFVPSKRRSGDLLTMAGIDISEIPQAALDAELPTDPNVSQLPTAASFLVYENEMWTALLVLDKSYNDIERTKQLNVTLVTYNWQGEKLDSRQLASQSIRYDMNNEANFEQYFRLGFDENHEVSLHLKTWRFIPRGGYSTGGWLQQPGWQISANGSIQKQVLNPIERDEQF